jgi:hypothetical protein
MFGGKLSKSNVFRKIYSIGFEMETGTLVKLAGHAPDEMFKDVFDFTLFNSDLNPSFASVLSDEYTEEDAMRNLELSRAFFESGSKDEEKIKEMLLLKSDSIKRLEPCDMPVIVSKNSAPRIDRNITFQVCNDRTNTLMSRYIQAYAGCKDMKDHADDQDFIPYSNLYEIDAYATDKNNKRIKQDGEYSKVGSYNVEFAYKEPDEVRECSEFSVVEWVITHYKPAEQRDIIWNALMKSFKILHNHLDKFTLKYDTDFIVSVNKADPDDPENIISYQKVLNIMANKRDKSGDFIIKNGKPVKSKVKFTLYNAPNTSLYYYRIGENPSLDEVGGRVQMTFTTHITDLPVVLNTLATNIKLTDGHSALQPFIRAAGILLKKYNKKSAVGDRIMFDKSEKRRTSKLGSVPRSKKSIEFLTYMALILYKINAYITQYTLNKWKVEEKEEIKKHYFKDYLTINCRHSNYDIYVALRKMIYDNFSDAFAGIDNEHEISQQITNIMIKLFVQGRDVFKFMYDELFYPKEADKSIDEEASGNIFGKYAEVYNVPATDIERITDPAFQPTESDPHFGDPLYSLASYFACFETGRVKQSNGSARESLGEKMAESANKPSSRKSASPEVKMAGEEKVGEGMVGEGMVGEGMVGEGMVGEGMVGEGMMGEGVMGEEDEYDREYDWFSYAMLENQSTKMPYRNGIIFIEMRGFYRSLCKEALTRTVNSIARGVFDMQPEGDIKTMMAKIKAEIENVDKYENDLEKVYKIHLIEELFKRYDYNELFNNRTLISTTKLLVAEYEKGIDGILTFIDNDILKEKTGKTGKTDIVLPPAPMGIILPPAPPASKLNATRKRKASSASSASSSKRSTQSMRSRRNVNDFSNINTLIPHNAVGSISSASASPSPLVKRTKRSAIVPTNYDIYGVEDAMEE